MSPKTKTLAEYLEATGTTQAKFAERIGVTQGYISKILAGEAIPRGPLALAIAKAADIPVETLLGKSEAA